MPTLDDFTLEEDAARRRRETRVASVSLRWDRDGQQARYSCDACAGRSCRHVLELVTAVRST